jgi:hypothetical protein
MSVAVMWISPEAPAPKAGSAQAARKPASGAIRFGILDNSKSNADLLLALVVEGVKAKHPAASIVTARKPSAANRAGKDVLDRLEEEADFVISAMAD